MRQADTLGETRKYVETIINVCFIATQLITIWTNSNPPYLIGTQEAS